MKKAFKIFWTVVAALFVLLFAVWMLIQTPGVQTFVAKRVTHSLEKKFNGKVEFSKIHFKPFNTLIIKDLRLVGDDLDTLASAKSIAASFTLRGLLKKEGLHMGRVSVEDASFTVVIDSLGNNVTRFFGSGKKDKKEKKEMGSIFDIRKAQVHLQATCS